MNAHKATTIAALALTAVLLAALALTAPPTHAAATREYIGAIDNNLSPGFAPAGIAVDQETGNVYLYTRKEESKTGEGEIEITGPEGGQPVGGVPAKITITGIIMDRETTAGIAGVAVDNSCYEHQPRLTGQACQEYDPAYNDVYVAVLGQGTASKYIEQYHLNNGVYEPVAKIGVQGQQLAAVTVDSSGNIYAVDAYVTLGGPDVLEFKKDLEHVVNAGKEETVEKLEQIVILTEGRGLVEVPGFVAADGSGGLYLSSYEINRNSREGNPGVVRLVPGSGGGVLSEELFVPTTSRGMRPVAVDRLTGDVFVGEPPSLSEEDAPAVAEFDASGEQQIVFGSKEALDGSFGNDENGPRGIAVDEASDRVYVINANKDDVDVFGPANGPAVIGVAQPGAVGVTRTSALIGGVADPESEHATYYFEYVDGEEFLPGASDPYVDGQQTEVGALPGGHVARTIERLALTGLSPGRTYHYRMVVSNASGTVHGPDETFTTLAARPPVATTGGVLGVSATTATITGVISPNGLQTGYVFEIGPGTGYGGAQLFGSAGDGTGPVAVSVELQYLAPGSTYHYRLVASSFDGTSYGQDGTFTTPGVPEVVVQPASEPQLASPSLQFPSLVGATGAPSTQQKSARTARGLSRALKACAKYKQRDRRAACRAHVRKRYKAGRLARPHRQGA
jgi:DNA-binding beta-propeller fold protein YncE